jgi:hypothetical protein
MSYHVSLRSLREYPFNLIWWHRNSLGCPLLQSSNKVYYTSSNIANMGRYVHHIHPSMYSTTRLTHTECTRTEKVSRHPPYHSDVLSHLGQRPPPRMSLTKSSNSPRGVSRLLKSVSSSETRTVSPRSNSLPETRSSGS